VALILYRTFEHGIEPVWESLSSDATLHALKLTLLITLIAVPANTVFGITLAIAIVRRRFRGKGIVNALVDLPLALSPVVVGLSLLLLYGRDGWIQLPFQVVFALPAMVLATIFVSLPFVVREVVPVLREIGEEQEQAAATLGASSFQIFRRITLPAIRWGVAYGVVLTTARCLGEFGAVTVVSGRIVGQTETLTIHVEQAYDNFDTVGAYSASLVLALIAISTLVLMNLLRPKEGV
jgi:sulfate transport system permease protein